MNPIDYIIYSPLPDYYHEAFQHNKALGWVSTDLTADSYDITKIKAGRCPLLHIQQYTLPKIEKIKHKISGFFLAEGDVKIDITYQQFLDLDIHQPTWLGYKKRLSTYIVGAFLLYIPINYFEEFKMYVNVKRLVYSDRLFTKLVDCGWLHLHPVSVASELPHYSNVLNAWRK